MSRRVKKLNFQVPNCIIRLPGSGIWHDSKTGDKVHVSKLEDHIKKNYGAPLIVVPISAETLQYKTVVNLVDPVEQLKEELIRERRYDLKGDN